MLPLLQRIADALERDGADGTPLGRSRAWRAFVWACRGRRLEAGAGERVVSRVDLACSRASTAPADILLDKHQALCRWLPANNALLWEPRHRPELASQAVTPRSTRPAGRRAGAGLAADRDPPRGPRLDARPAPPDARPPGRSCCYATIVVDGGDTRYKSHGSGAGGRCRGPANNVLF